MSNNGLYTPPPGRPRSTSPAPGPLPREARSVINQQNSFVFRERLKNDPEFKRQWRAKISATMRVRYAELAAKTLPNKTPEAKEKWRRSIAAGRQAAIRAARKAAQRRNDDETGDDYIWMEANDYARKSRIGYAGAMSRMVRYEWKKEQRPGRTWIFRVPNIYCESALTALPAPVATVAAIEPPAPRRWWSWLRFWR